LLPTRHQFVEQTVKKANMVNMKKNALVSKIKEIAVCLEATEMVMLVMLPETILPPNKIGQMNLLPPGIANWSVAKEKISTVTCISSTEMLFFFQPGFHPFPLLERK
jgi:hypothetical protein